MSSRKAVREAARWFKESFTGGRSQCDKERNEQISEDQE